MGAILVIDDQPQLLKNVSTILRLEGFTVVTASNGLEGWEILSKEPVDLVVCDVAMPSMDGFELIERIRAHPLLKSLPFVFLTARTDRADTRKGMELGAYDYLTKPFTRNELLGMVRSCLAKQAAVAASSQNKFTPDFTSSKPLEQLGLTAREAEVLLWTAQGKTNADIACILGMAEKTVKNHLSSVFQKMGVEGRHAASLNALMILSSGR